MIKVREEPPDTESQKEKGGGRMKKLLMLLTMVVASTLVISGFAMPAQAQKKPVELTMVMFLPDIPPGNFWSHMFMDKVKAISKGELVIKLMGGPEAIPAPDAPAAAQRGSVDIANSMFPFSDTLAPGMDALGRAEYSPAELRKNGALEFVQKLFAKSGIYFLGAASPSDPQVQTCIYLKKEIKTIDDLKGLKIAATGGSNRAHIDGLGAVCVPIGFPEYFTAMERGVVDGYNIGIPGIQDFGLTPVTGYMLDELFSSNGAGFLVNMKKWNSLPQNLKDVLTKAAIETEIDGCREWNGIVAKVKKDISAAGVKIIKFSHEDSVKFYRNYRDKMGAEDLRRSPENVAQLQKFTLNPKFYRLK
jgi:TRAP-type C4-dicarboxylate transport system substrate-binding protein